MKPNLLLCRWPDDNIPFVVRDNLPDVISTLGETGEKRFIWFSDNQMKLNTDKWDLLLNTQDQNFLKIENFNIKNSFPGKLLGITFNCKLKFSNHIEDICKNVTRKVNALSRIVSYIDISRRKILMNTFFRSQFNCCSLIWMCYNCSLNHKINRLHERCLRIIYSDMKSSFVQRKKCPYSGLFWSALFPAFSRIRTEYGEILRYSVCLRIQSECGKMREKCGPE